MLRPFKRITATVVAISLIMTALSTSAWAEDDLDIDETEVSEELPEETDISAETYDDSEMDRVRYLRRGWSGSAVTEISVETYDYTYITSSTETLTSGTYVVNGSVTNNHRITVTGDVDLILPDGVNLKASKGIKVNQGCTLSIFGWIHDTGKIEITNPGDDNAGIGGSNGKVSGSIVIHGGTIDVNGGNEASGIGGGNGSSSGFEGITIYGGYINSRASRDASGIGSGANNSSTLGKILIYGGSITAEGKEYGSGIGGGYKSCFDEIVICGGAINASSDGSAGIGSGSFSSCHNITINGGFVQASGRGGAGIGAGFNASQNGTITINGGLIEAASDGGSVAMQEFGGGAGIGGSYGHSGGIININGGDIFACGVAGAGIGGGEGGNSGTITIRDGNILAVSRNFGAGIGGGKNGNCESVTIYDGSITAKGCDYDYSLVEAWCDNGSIVPEEQAFCLQAVVGFAEDFFAGLIISGDYGGSGIGGGYNGKGGTVDIRGGFVDVKGGESAVAIGHGEGNSSNGTLLLYTTAGVLIDGTEVLADNRVSAVQSNREAVIKECEHPEFSYTPLPDGSGHVGTCRHCDYNTGNEPHQVYRRVCDQCRYHVEDYVQGYSIDLASDIAVNFYLKLSDSVLNNDNAYIQVTLPNGQEEAVWVRDIRDEQVYIDPSYLYYDPPEGDDNLYYRLTVHIAAKELTKPITAQVISGDYEGPVYRFLFSDYSNLFLYMSGSYYKKAKQLVSALLVYGACAQRYFGYNTDNLADDNSLLTPKPIPASLNIDYSDPEIFNLPDGVELECASLILKSDIRIGLYFSVPENTDVVFRYNGEEITPVTVNGLKKIVIPGVMISQLNDDFTIEVGDGHVRYSPMNYIQSVLDDGSDENLEILVKRLYLYYLEAEAYLA